MSVFRWNEKGVPIEQTFVLKAEGGLAAVYQEIIKVEFGKMTTTKCGKDSRSFKELHGEHHLRVRLEAMVNSRVRVFLWWEKDKKTVPASEVPFWAPVPFTRQRCSSLTYQSLRPMLHLPEEQIIEQANRRGYVISNTLANKTIGNLKRKNKTDLLRMAEDLTHFLRLVEENQDIVSSVYIFQPTEVPPFWSVGGTGQIPPLIPLQPLPEVNTTTTEIVVSSTEATETVVAEATSVLPLQRLPEPPRDPSTSLPLHMVPLRPLPEASLPTFTVTSIDTSDETAEAEKEKAKHAVAVVSNKATMLTLLGATCRPKPGMKRPVLISSTELTKREGGCYLITTACQVPSIRHRHNDTPKVLLGPCAIASHITREDKKYFGEHVGDNYDMTRLQAVVTDNNTAANTTDYAPMIDAMTRGVGLNVAKAHCAVLAERAMDDELKRLGVASREKRHAQIEIALGRRIVPTPHLPDHSYKAVTPHHHVVVGSVGGISGGGGGGGAGGGGGTLGGSVLGGIIGGTSGAADNLVVVDGICSANTAQDFRRLLREARGKLHPRFARYLEKSAHKWPRHFGARVRELCGLGGPGGERPNTAPLDRHHTVFKESLRTIPNPKWFEVASVVSSAQQKDIKDVLESVYEGGEYEWTGDKREYFFISAEEQRMLTEEERNAHHISFLTYLGSGEIVEWRGQRCSNEVFRQWKMEEQRNYSLPPRIEIKKKTPKGIRQKRIRKKGKKRVLTEEEKYTQALKSMEPTFVFT